MTTIQLLADLLIPVGVALLWAAFHIFLGHGLFLPMTYTEIREGDYLNEDSTINDCSTAASLNANDLQ